MFNNLPFEVASVSEFKTYQDQFKNLNNWMGKILPNVLDAFLIIAVVSVLIRTVVLMLAGSVWAITLLGAGKQNIGAA